MLYRTGDTRSRDIVEAFGSTVFGVLSLAVLALDLVTFAAQERPPAGQSVPLFRGGVEVVNVAATVWDASGEPVTDLSADDFEIYERGRRQPVQVFQRVAIPILREAEELFLAHDSPDVASNAFPDQTRAFLILLDDIHIAGTNSEATRRILKELVERRMGSRDLVAIASTTGQPAVALDFTAEKQRVVRALDRFVGRRPPRDNFLDPAFDAQATMGFISQAARGLAGATGPRVTVLLVSEGVTYDTDKMTDPKSSDTIRAVKQAVESLKRGNVILYAIDPRGLATRDADDTLASQIQNEVADHDALTKYRLDDSLRISVQSLVHLSEATGGFALVNANDYRAGLDRVVREAGIYYLLGYAPTTPAREGEFRAIEIRMRRAGLRVSSRQGYVREPARPVLQGQSTLRSGSPAVDALYRTLPTSGLRLRVQPILLPDPGGRWLVRMMVEVAGRDLAFAREGQRLCEDVSLALLTVDARGHRSNGTEATVKLRLPVTDIEPVAQPDVRWLVPLVLRTGRYQVRVSAHGARTNRTGAVFVDLDVPPAKARLTISTLVMTSELQAPSVIAGDWSSFSKLPEPPTTARLFRQGDTVRVAATIWVPKGVVSPKEAMVRLREATPNAAALFERQIALQSTANGMAELLATMPTDALAPGRFVLTVEVGDSKSDSSRTTSRQTAFEVVPRF